MSYFSVSPTGRRTMISFGTYSSICMMKPSPTMLHARGALQQRWRSALFVMACCIGLGGHNVQRSPPAPVYNWRSLQKCGRPSCSHTTMTSWHLGVNRTIDALRRLYWWPGMYPDIEKWVLECVTCQARKNPAERKKGLMMPMPTVSRPFQRVGMDLITSFPLSARGNKYLLIFMDYLTKWPEAVALPNKKADTVARAFVEHVVCRHGAPESLLSDRGKEFMNRVLKEVNALLKISKLNTSPYHPQTDGMVERFNSTIENMLSKFVSDDQKDWDVLVPYVLFAYRSTTHEVTGESPFFLMYGREPYFPLDITLSLQVNDDMRSVRVYRHELVTRLIQAHRVASERMKEAGERSKKRYDTTRMDHTYLVADLVWMFMFGLEPATSCQTCPVGQVAHVEQRSTPNSLLLLKDLS
ncbi:integrase core domain containing protein [Acanthamoeba castellanii str. Neff]|uniref:Integrase core domain containing protein n=1 Tax=Acanthamoeba castellanii (strain ATCC 30010 / Neff) TaxID=1257118 RepID=L8GPV3_ACACF|nr:integrase core domain containing protein [Acanthamoeba castellanii str. Neff]ELR14136.1 integrase core domain containing protein [Acanthamoeba castellanii str. Neff]